MERPDEQGRTTVNRYVTGRVLKALKDSRISNLRFERLTDMEVDVGVYAIGSQYRLPRDYDARAAALYAKKRASDERRGRKQVN